MKKQLTDGVIEYQIRLHGFYDLFCDSYYTYRSLMIKMEQKELQWQCPACPKVIIFYNFILTAQLRRIANGKWPDLSSSGRQSAPVPI
jgi:hypothetical protein